MFKLAFDLALLYFGVHWGFLACIRAKAIIEDETLEEVVRHYWKIMVLPLAVIFILGDWAFNIIFGSMIFREPPKEKLFSHRIQRHVNELSQHDYETALKWAKRLNAVDPGHIKIP